jgi:hypothetical protein
MMSETATEKVNKPFNTVNRRFKPGMEVTEADVAPLDFAHLKEAGFIGSAREPDTSATPRKSKKSE